VPQNNVQLLEMEAHDYNELAGEYVRSMIEVCFREY
jgi:hypothetical protein